MRAVIATNVEPLRGSRLHGTRGECYKRGTPTGFTWEIDAARILQTWNPYGVLHRLVRAVIATNVEPLRGSTLVLGDIRFGKHGTHGIREGVLWSEDQTILNPVGVQRL